jgi:hypothetical protein
MDGCYVSTIKSLDSVNDLSKWRTLDIHDSIVTEMEQAKN